VEYSIGTLKIFMVALALTEYSTLGLRGCDNSTNIKVNQQGGHKS
jgi:hypothetical protein